MYDRVLVASDVSPARSDRLQVCRPGRTYSADSRIRRCVAAWLTFPRPAAGQPGEPPIRSLSVRPLAPEAASKPDAWVSRRAPARCRITRSAHRPARSTSNNADRNAAARPSAGTPNRTINAGSAASAGCAGTVSNGA